MAHHSHVPKFGNWDAGENMPYTVYFDKARQGRAGGKMINPNDPEENYDVHSSDSMPPAQAPPLVQAGSDRPGEHRPGRPIQDWKISDDHSDLERFAADGTDHQGQGARGAGSGTGDEAHKRVGRGSAGSDHSINKSPIHHQARISGRGSSSPSWEGRVARESGHGTPGRSRLGGASRTDEPVDRGSTVPKFGDWDENNPASADGYTGIFNKVREERQTEARNGPGYLNSPYRPAGVKKAPNNTSKICCFPWRRS